MARDSLRKNLTVFILDEDKPKISVNGAKGYYGLRGPLGFVEENQWDILLGPKCIVSW